MNPEENKSIFDTQSLDEIWRMIDAAPGEVLRESKPAAQQMQQQPSQGAQQEDDGELAQIKRLLEDESAQSEEASKPQQDAPTRDNAAKKTEAAADSGKIARAKKTKAEKKQQAKKKEKLSPAAEAYAMLHDWVYVLAALTLIFVFFFRLVGVSGSSMYPTLVDRDYLVLQSNFLYTGAKRGDVVVLSVDCFADDGPIVKRVIATGGQTVDIDFETGEVFVDGILQDEPYIFEPTYRDNADIGEALDYPVVVPEGSVFVMGDNRNHSADSRYAPCGCIPEDQILGKVLLLIVPGQQTDEFGEITGGRAFGRIGAIS